MVLPRVLLNRFALAQLLCVGMVYIAEMTRVRTRYAPILPPVYYCSPLHFWLVCCQLCAVGSVWDGVLDHNYVNTLTVLRGPRASIDAIIAKLNCIYGIGFPIQNLQCFPHVHMSLHGGVNCFEFPHTH